METAARSSSLLDDFAAGAAARSWFKFLFVIYNPQILLILIAGMPNRKNNVRHLAFVLTVRFSLSTIAMISPCVVRMRIVATTRVVNQSDDTQYRYTAPYYGAQLHKEHVG